MNNTLEFTCAGITDEGRFIIDHTGRGQNISPEFVINNLSKDAKTIAITLEDLNHPVKDFTHWIIWNIPATNHIEKAIPAGKVVKTLGNTKQGIGYGMHRYAGPKPPKGMSHTYRFTIYALDCEINLEPNHFKKKFLKIAEYHILQKGSIEGIFE